MLDQTATALYLVRLPTEVERHKASGRVTRSNGMQVLFFLAGDETRASTRYRILNMLPYLERAGIECDTINSIGLLEPLPTPLQRVLGLILLAVRAPQYDIVYVQKTPLPGPYVWLLSLVTDVVYDFDDALYTTPPWENDRRLRRHLLIGMLRTAQYVVTGNDHLSAYAKRYTQHVRCLPTAIPKEKYTERDRTTDDGTTIGWIGNPENLHYLAAHEEPLTRILEAHPTVRLLIITAGDLPVEPLRERDDVEYRKWSLETELDSLSDVDIGIRPLFDDEWTRAKGGFTSVVQMMALRIPVVVTPVGMLTELVVDGENGYLAQSDEEWVESLSNLIEQSSRRDEMGENAFRTVDNHGFWTEDRASELLEVLKSVAEQSEP